MTSESLPNPRRRAFLAGGLALGTAAVLPLWTPGRAQAAGTPAIAGTGAWGARPANGPLQVLPTPPQKIIVHHTATANVTDYSQSQAFQLARSMQNWAMDDRQWNDTGQHFTVSRGAYVMEGRHNSLAALQNGTQTVESAHCVGQNTIAIGIENEGTYTTVDPRGEQYATLVDLCAYICGQYGLRAYQIYGHRDFNATQCPGDRLYAMLPQLRQAVAARIGGDPTAPVWPLVHNGDSGDRVRALQHLLVRRGATITVDGGFGPATEQAVRDFQTLMTATSDGYAGNQTWHQLVVPVRQGDTGEAVKAVQLLLTAKGVPTDADGDFGPGTRSAVASFQSTAGLPSDGLADARTFSRLLV
ncbi:MULTISPECIES: N-acetylmuramoyl-L-alanine amidase [unclassified Streptomyces]|uniref:peptidoglycan recognition protein family protein n=1 Tax=unclassified Streptomyces TaxID=2593676 RepID=UPI00166135B6|nr:MULTISPECIES: N-acetylmuramoyl-L-alanine amidase [unclassified Streptomyces]MBD0711031.1 N-acetylmuramoyl-L-alanine amidase [Streptomyces sp. CBMA291]MBD0712983.1 N-acetylmuramoyl-L-alanine amidase [Streptomyces sp. CBMA370]